MTYRSVFLAFKITPSILFAFVIVSSLTFSFVSCSKKVGCPAMEQSTKAKLKKNGMPKSKSRSGVMPKSMTNKQMKKRRKPKNH